jgi:hypothetical protein
MVNDQAQVTVVPTSAFSTRKGDKGAQMDVFVRQIILQSPNAIDTTKFTQSWLKSP